MGGERPAAQGATLLRIVWLEVVTKRTKSRTNESWLTCGTRGPSIASYKRIRSSVELVCCGLGLLCCPCGCEPSCAAKCSTRRMSSLAEMNGNSAAKTSTIPANCQLLEPVFRDQTPNVKPSARKPSNSHTMFSVESSCTQLQRSTPSPSYA